MPDAALTNTVQHLEQTYRARLITRVFQSDDQTIDGGVCRGMAAKWIGALALGAAALDDLRARMTWVQGQPVHHEFVSYQKAFDEVTKKFDEARAQYRELVRNAEQILGKLTGTIKLGWFESMPSTTDLDAANHYLAKYGASRLDVALSLIALYIGGGVAQANVRGKVTRPYGLFLASPSGLCGGTDAYYLGLGLTHALAARASATQYMFFDANTGEWALESAADFDRFLPVYMQRVYAAHYQGQDVVAYAVPIATIPEDWEFSDLKSLFD